MMSDPTEYISFSLDCVDKQKSMVPKTHACKLIESICDSVHTANSYITKFCCSVINLVYGGSQAEGLYDKSILQLQHEVFFQSDQVLIVDTCLLMLTCMSYVIPTRQDLMTVLSDTIETNLEKLSAKPEFTDQKEDDMSAAKSVILPTHLSLVIGYYADLLFKRNTPASSAMLHFIMESIHENRGKLEVISRGCVDTLSIIITDAETLPLMVQEIDMVVQEVLKLIETIDYTNFYDFLSDF